MLICEISCLHYKSFSQVQHCQKCVNIGLYNDISIIINFQILVSASALDTAYWSGLGTWNMRPLHGRATWS